MSVENIGGWLRSSVEAVADLDDGRQEITSNPATSLLIDGAEDRLYQADGDGVRTDAEAGLVGHSVQSGHTDGGVTGYDR